MKTSKNEKNYGFWNWGTGITITFIIAASAMLFLVYKTTTANLEMAEDNYYEQEMKFSHQLDASKNAATLSAAITIQEDETFLKITVPQECVDQKATGKIWLYRPSSEKNDLHLAFEPDSNGDIFVEQSKLIKGIYRLKADWQMSGMDYHQEQSFYVEKSATK